MKKGILYLLTGCLLLATSVKAQDDKAIKDAALANPKDAKVTDKDDKKAWKFGGGLGANFGQVALVNWAAGGQNSISFLLTGNAFVYYKKGRVAWDNDLSVNWGMIAQGRMRDIKNNKYPVRKNVDLLQFTSKAGYSLDKKAHWFVAGLVDFKSGLTNGWDYSSYDADHVNGTRQRVSKFAAPAYLTTSVGVLWKPVTYFSLYVSPVAGKFTFVSPDVPGAVSSTDIDETRYGLTKGAWHREEFGAYLRADFNKDIFKNVNVTTSLELFENYLDKKHVDVLDNTRTYDNRKNVDVNWATMITFKVNKYLSANLGTNLIWDYDVAVPMYSNTGTTFQGRGVQFREAFNLGVGYKF